ncbi:MAG TPA: hypothetical protein VGG36_12560 [Rhizomicrobium sp.]|jgi:hypothetical protein
MPADQINVSVTKDRKLARLTVKSEKGNGDAVHFSAADIEKLIRLLAESRAQLQPARAPAAKPGEKIDLTLNPAFGVTPPQKEGPVANMAILLLADVKYGLLSYAFGREQWETLDAAVRAALPPVS